MNLVSALLQRVPWRGRLVADVLPVHVMYAFRTLMVFIGFALICSAVQLWQRKRRAWQFVIGMLAVSLAMQLLQGSDYVKASMFLRGLAALVTALVALSGPWKRRWTATKPGRREVQRALSRMTCTGLAHCCRRW